MVYTTVLSNGNGEGRHWYCRVVLGRLNLTWCPVYKAGSSNWMRNFAQLSGLNVTSRCLDRCNLDITVQRYTWRPCRNLTSRVLSSLTGSYPDTVTQLRTTRTMLIVRNPWDRLLRCFVYFIYFIWFYVYITAEL